MPRNKSGVRVLVGRTRGGGREEEEMGGNARIKPGNRRGSARLPMRGQGQGGRDHT
jgi:hypothetical protein